MTVATIDTVAVLGAGTMGHGIAEIAALAGYDVVLRDIDDELLETAIVDIDWSLKKLVEREEVTADDASAARERIATTVVLDPIATADVIIEAVPEDVGLKRTVYDDVVSVAADDAIIATNTSALSITELAAATDRPSRFCGMHFFNPPVRMDLVEVIGGAETSSDTIETIEALATSMDKEPVRVERDAPGFIVNRILIQFLNDAAWRVNTEEASIAAVDASTTCDLGLPMGAFELADQIGLDVAADITAYLHAELGDAYEPCPLLESYVEGGTLGQKTGEGFYDYNDGGVNIAPEDSSPTLAHGMLAVMANEVAKLYGAEVASVDAIDRAMQLGAGFPEGPGKMADEHGVDALLKQLEESYDRTGHPRYEPADAFRDAAEAGGFCRNHEPNEFDTLRIERPAPGVASVIIDRPHRLNAITPTVLDDLTGAIEHLEADDRVRAVILRGAGDRAFSAGADLQAMPNVLDAPAAAVALAEHGQTAFARLRTSPLPIIAAIEGYCLGGGFELAASADLRIAATGSTFGQTERNLGLIPGWGGTQRIAPIIGLGRALELVMTGDHYDPATMVDYGFVNEIFDHDGFEESVRDYAKQVASGPSVALGAAKRAIYAGVDESDAGLAAESQSFGQLTTTDDLTEGISAFLEDRDPSFTGE